jgi:hypothetical protein
MPRTLPGNACAARMSHSEYLRRKVEAMPKYYGPARLGDESLKTQVRRFQAAGAPIVSTAPAPPTACCRHAPYPRLGDGQQQDWSVDAVIARAAHCAVCRGDSLSTGIWIPAQGECCPVAPDVPRAALAGHGRTTCCPSTGPPLQELTSTCCSTTPNGVRLVNTVYATGIPADSIPPLPKGQAAFAVSRTCRACPPVSVDPCPYISG